MIDYMVGLSTRNRKVILNKCLQEFLVQKNPPRKFIICDNNDEGGVSEYIQNLAELYEIVEVIKNDCDNKGDAKGSELIYERYKDEFEYILKWDDDLIPDDYCAYHLCKTMEDAENVVAVGGMYPKLGETKTCYFNRENQIVVPDGNSRHVQFFNWYNNNFMMWHGEDINIKIHHLYSSFLYSTEAAKEVGGYYSDYIERRHETDFTLRLNTVGNLLICTKARAVHYFSKEGGCRDFDEDESKMNIQRDLELFETRMKEAGIDPDY